MKQLELNSKTITDVAFTDNANLAVAQDISQYTRLGWWIIIAGWAVFYCGHL